MRITLHFSGGLRAVLAHLPEELTIHMDGPASLREILVQAGINPLLVVLITVDGKRGEKDQVIDHDARINVVGPMAGG
jgi:sulfur carrier protein ThiS